MLPHLVWLVLGVEDGQLSEHAHVCPLLAQSCLHEGDDLLKETPVLVVVDQLIQLIGVDNDVQAADLRQTELPAIHTREANLQHKGVGVGWAAQGDVGGVGVSNQSEL